MNPKIRKLLLAIRDLHKAYDKVERAVPNPTQAEQKSIQAVKTVFILLEEDEVAAQLDTMLKDSTSQLVESSEQIVAKLQENKDEIITDEIKTIRPFTIKFKKFDGLIKLSIHFTSQGDLKYSIVGSSEVHTKFKEIHKEILAAYREIREVKLPRKQKKKRKRQIAQGVFQALSGIALLVGNTTFPELMVYSCTLGISAFMQAGANFIGETE